jgi:hypothetical protein
VNKNPKMKSATRARRQNTLYSHSSPPGEVDHLKVRWADEKQAAVEDIRRKNEERERTIRQEKARDHPRYVGRGDDHYDRWRKKDSKEHQERLAAIDRRYERELEEASKRNPRE